ncbi:MAG: putative C-S lyase [Bacteroidia bacterium]|nr:MAG: putative C-S lyase [Bacteroidia bacterium]
MVYNFDEPVERQGTSCVKYDLRKDVFGNENVIPMWVADMDFKTPPFIIEALRERLNHEILGYTIRRDAYFSSIISWVNRRYSWDIKREWISFSPGIVPAINICTLAFTEPGDKIIVQPPVYFPFFPAVEDHDRTLVLNPLAELEGFWSFDLEDLKRKMGLGARMLILSNPHNPVGRSWKPDELRQLAELCLENNVLILSDEIHSDLVLPGYKHTPIASLSKEIADITITCLAPSKTFNLAGMATSSVIISDPGLSGRFNRMIEKMHIGMGNIMGTEASIAAYTHGDEWLAQLLEYININIEFVIEYCKKHIPAIIPVRPEATYMIWLDCRALGMEPGELSRFFIEKASLGLNEGSTFGMGGEGFMRMNVACSYQTVKEAMEGILYALNKLNT